MAYTDSTSVILQTHLRFTRQKKSTDKHAADERWKREIAELTALFGRVFTLVCQMHSHGATNQAHQAIERHPHSHVLLENSRHHERKWNRKRDGQSVTHKLFQVVVTLFTFDCIALGVRIDANRGGDEIENTADQQYEERAHGNFQVDLPTFELLRLIVESVHGRHAY